MYLSVKTKGQMHMELKIENMIIELLLLESKMTKATYDGRGVQTAARKRDSLIKKMSKEMDLDVKYLLEKINQ